jgi:O-antigen ligase
VPEPTEPTARLRPRDIGCALAWGASSAFFLVLLASLFREEHIPTLVVPVLFGIAGLAVWRTGMALMLVAVLVPIATWTGRQWNGAVAWPETLVVACLAGYTARRAFTREPGHAGSLNFAIYSLIAVVIGSLAVRLLVLRATIGGEALGAHLWNALGAHYFTERGSVQLDAAMRLIEGTLLLHAGATTTRANPPLAPDLIRSVVFGAAAAGALNLWRIWVGALRLESPVMAFLGYLRTLRFNAHYGDVNAAGSYCMMTLLPALAAGWVGRRWLWAIASVPIATSLVLSGSRSAIVAGIAATLVVLYLARGYSSLRLSPRRARTTLIGAIVVAAACAGVLSLLAVRNATPALAALWIRVEFARTGIQMVRSAPAFGVGIGDYSMRSTEFASPQLLKIYPRENAHNNFLQVLSELGIVGLAVFVWVLGAAAAASARNLARDPRNPLRWAATAGALAFVISWLGGHPLLLDAPAFSFWLLLGTMAGWGSVAAAKPPRAVSPAAAASLLAVAVAISLPVRFGAELGRAELEHQGIGLSGWLDSAEGVRHRLAGVSSTVFVPASARVVTVPLRAAETNQQLVVELRLDDRLANVLRVPGDRWLTLRLPLPSSQGGTRYRRLDLEVRSPASTESPLLMIGKVTPM